ncbi:MAG: hydrogenase expression/formation protein HypE [Proteobacteria bacterium]|nr:hydrogenase expression/formation protein HypE [Pseudomonadota bacterium]
MANGGRIQLGHGGGGRLSRDLVEGHIAPRFGDGPLRGLPDAARLAIGGASLVFTTDSFVVSPKRFPGGDIGDLAVYGTVNDIAVGGGRPLWLSLALICEEGLPFEELDGVLDSVARAAARCGVGIATGDTKVVARGQCDGLYVNTAGIGEALPGFELGADRLAAGDAVIASGDLGDHGMAVMAARAGMDVGGRLVSDTGPVHGLVLAVADLAPMIRFMRDPTRGGAASTLNEMLGGRADVGILLREREMPFSDGARAVAEVLGVDLLHVASEGRALIVCAPEASAEVLERWRRLPEGSGARVIGSVTRDRGRVVLETSIGGRRLVDVPQGELLPRIC